MKKSKITTSHEIKKTVVPNSHLVFSYKYFDSSDSEMCPSTFHENYTHILMDRLKALSSMSVNEFINNFSKSLRIHSHDWSKTSRPKGFINLPKHLQSCLSWQFELSQSKHDRVHGIILENIFYVIWLDQNHKLYPSRL